jgi:hypothetical protein
MATNFPGSLDTFGAGGTIGGPFVDAAPPVDLFVDIAADFRSNLNDAMLAVQSRVGLTNSTDPGSLSWATLAAGGVNNLGLRFAQDETGWPGAVGESGIFLKDGTLEPMFHRAGEPVGTFYSMLGGGSSGDLQDAYNASSDPATIAMSGTKNMVFHTHSSGAAFALANEAGTNYFITADETSGDLLLGDSTTIRLNLDGRVISDIQFDGSLHYLSNTSASVGIRTLGTGDVLLDSVGRIIATSVSSMSLVSDAKVTVSSTAGTIDVDTTTGADINIFSGDKIVIRSGGAGGEEMSLLTGSDDPTSVAKWAHRGSLYLRDTGAAGELYVKQDNASSTNWTLLGVGGAGTLQSVYNASGTPAVLAMSGATKHLNFRTNSAGSSFILSDQADASTFIVADESSGDMKLGDGTVYTLNMDGRVSSNIQFDGASRNLQNTGPLTVQTGGVGPIDLSILGSGILTLQGLTIDLQSGGAVGEIMNLVTGTTDPTSVAATGTRGSLYLRDTGAAGELYVKQDNGSSTNWTQLGAGGAATLQTAYDAGNTIVTSGGNNILITGSESFIWDNAATKAFTVGLGTTPHNNISGLFRVGMSAGADGAHAVACNASNLAGNNGREFGAFKATVTDASDLDDTDIIYAYQANLSMLGDGPGAGASGRHLRSVAIHHSWFGSGHLR